MNRVERADKTNLLSYVQTWVLCAVLLVFASVYGFSFERGSLNTEVGSATFGIAAPDAQQGALMAAQNGLVYLLAVLCIFPLARQVWERFQSSILITLLIAWAFCSALWSSNPSTTIVNSTRLGICIALTMYLVERYSPNDLQKLVLLAGMVAAAASLVLIFLFPQYGLQSRGAYALGAWEGIWGHKNLCGLEMLLLLLPAFFVKLPGKLLNGLRLLYIFAALVIIAMTKSAGGWVVTALCLTFIGACKLLARMKSRDRMAAILIFAAIGFTTLAVVVTQFDQVMSLLGKDPTMTGRTIIWAVLFRSIAKHPLTGYGLMAFWNMNEESTRVATELNISGYSSAESGILELWLELGLVGVLLYFAIFATAVKNAIRCLKRGATPAVLWYLSILFFVFATNIEGGHLVGPSDLVSVLPFVAFIGLRHEARRTSDEQVLHIA